MTTTRLSILPESAHRYIPYFLLAVAVFIAYGNVYENDFLFDDNLLITLNRYLLSWKTFPHLLTGSTIEGARIQGGFYRPLQMVLYFFIYQMGGQVPFGFHLLNVSLHAANGCLAYGLARRLNLHAGAAFFGALLWVLHPLHTEAVTYISGTADPLFVFFGLIGLLILLPDVTTRKTLLALPFFILALLGKETAIVFPPLAMCCLYLMRKDRLKVKIYFRTWPLWVVAIAFAVWRATAPGFDGPQSYGRLYQLHDYYNLKLYAENPLWRFYTFFATLPAYASLVAWPVGLHMERSFTIYASIGKIAVLGGIAMVLAAMVQIFLSRRGGRGLPLSWGLLWFGIAQFPDTGILVPMNSLFLEHWMYLPTLGLFLGVAQYLSNLLDSGICQRLPAKNIAAGLACILASILAVMTWNQNTIWHDPVVFYKNIFAHGEVSARARNNLALAYLDQKKYEEAIDQFKQAIAETDSYAETRHNLGLAYLHLPDQQAHIQDAIDNLNRAIAIDPNFYRSYLGLAEIYNFMGDHEKADAYKRKAADILNKTNH